MIDGKYGPPDYDFGYEQRQGRPAGTQAIEYCAQGQRSVCQAICL
jgi:hypothetical protein